jgi:hypothetical protein
MKNCTVVSREYKVMLQPTRFTGSQKKLLETAAEFWKDFSHTIGPLIREADGSLDRVAKRRLVAFFDTDNQQLRENGYMFRVRRSMKTGEPEVTLKFRHPDRYIAEKRQMKSPHTQAHVKFEEDIKGPFNSFYSHSGTGKIGKKALPSTLSDIARLFPDLAKRLANRRDGKLAVSEVRGFTASELVISGAAFRIGSSLRTPVQCALIVWYDHKGSPTDPVAVEFSFRYGDQNGQYGGKTSKRAYDIFQVLQKDFATWIDPNPRTKTTFVYG